MNTIPKGPRGEKHPADVIGRAVIVRRIAYGDAGGERHELTSAAAQLGQQGREEARRERDAGGAASDSSEGRSRTVRRSLEDHCRILFLTVIHWRSGRFPPKAAIRLAA